MKYIDITLATPALNLACDEALLELCEEGIEDELLRFWEPSEYFVVLGSSNKVTTEVDRPRCEEVNVPILRRHSGGGTVLQGPGCLNFALILRIDKRGELAGISESNAYIMERQRRAVCDLIGRNIEVRGFTDLTVDGLKFSGNSQRRRQNCLLFHGTFLTGFEISLIEQLLPMPSKKPAYRMERSHGDFLTNIKIEPAVITSAIKNEWETREELSHLPTEKLEKLVREKYGQDEWNFKF